MPLEDQVTEAFHRREQVSRTLEYAYDDFVLAQVAKKLGKTDDYKALIKRAENYRNVIDPETGYARGRHADGTWIERSIRLPPLRSSVKGLLTTTPGMLPRT